MKLIIDGREYDGSKQPFIGDLRLLKPEFGFGWDEVIKRLQALDEQDDMIALVGDQDFLDALVAWMWMSRLRAGERDLTRREAEMVALDQITMVGDAAPDETPADDADPTSAPTGSDRGDDSPQSNAAEEPIPGSTQTSTPRSTAA